MQRHAQGAQKVRIKQWKTNKQRNKQTKKMHSIELVTDRWRGESPWRTARSAMSFGRETDLQLLSPIQTPGPLHHLFMSWYHEGPRRSTSCAREHSRHQKNVLMLSQSPEKNNSRRMMKWFIISGVESLADQGRSSEACRRMWYRRRMCLRENYVMLSECQQNINKMVKPYRNSTSPKI